MSKRDTVETKRLRGVGVAVGMLLAAGAGQAGGVGPDAFGYVANDATVYSFVDIASTGVGVLAGADDDQAIVNIGFPFQFYGQSYTTACLSTNGLISFGGCNMAFANQDLTSSSPPGNLPTVAPFWSDLTFAERGSGAIHYQTIGIAPNRRFIVQWTNVYPINAPEGITFQAILFESSNRILFQYQDVNAGAGFPVSLGGRATVGIRDVNGQANGRHVQWSYNAPVLRANSALEFLPPASTAVDLGAAGPRYWALLCLGGPTSLTTSGSFSVTGTVANVGVAASGNVTMSGTASIGGQLWLNTGGSLTQSGTIVITGGVVKTPSGDATLQQAAANARAASAAAAALSPTIQTPSSITIAGSSQSMTITGGPGLNVVKLTNLTIASGVLTLSAPAGARFVVNITGLFVMSGASRVELAGGLTPLNVLFNGTGTGGVSMSGGSITSWPKAQFSGILLAPKGSLTAAPVSVMGQVIVGGASMTASGTGRIHNPY